MFGSGAKLESTHQYSELEIAMWQRHSQSEVISFHNTLLMGTLGAVYTMCRYNCAKVHVLACLLIYMAAALLGIQPT